MTQSTLVYSKKVTQSELLKINEIKDCLMYLNSEVRKLSFIDLSFTHLKHTLIGNYLVLFMKHGSAGNFNESVQYLKYSIAILDEQINSISSLSGQLGFSMYHLLRNYHKQLNHILLTISAPVIVNSE